MSEAQTANAHGGRQASLGELRSSPVPGENELSPNQARSQVPRTDNSGPSRIQSENKWAPTILSTSYFIMTSFLIHTQFAYATVDHELNSCSNNEAPNSQRTFVSDRYRSSI